MRIKQSLNLLTCGIFSRYLRPQVMEYRPEIICRIQAENDYFIVSRSNDPADDKWVFLKGFETAAEMKEGRIKIEEGNHRVIEVIRGKENLKDYIDVHFIFYSKHVDYGTTDAQPEFKIN